MPGYLSFQFPDTPESVQTFDELPLWSAPFGLLLLQHLELRHGLIVIDVGTGAGFPLLELAQRLGPSCKCYGIDPWINANNRAREKAKNYNIENVEIIDGTADDLPFATESADLIVSNLGINNFSEPGKVLRECRQVLKPGGNIAITTNLNGHWREFYKQFEFTLLQLGMQNRLQQLKEHEEHRGTVDTISELFIRNGFETVRHFEDTFEMKFLDGSAFLNHHFVKLGWLASWKGLIPVDKQVTFFERLEQNLNEYARKNSGLTLTVPMAYIEARKI